MIWMREMPKAIKKAIRTIIQNHVWLIRHKLSTSTKQEWSKWPMALPKSLGLSLQWRQIDLPLMAAKS